jgi:hypothetical protein
VLSEDSRASKLGPPSITLMNRPSALWRGRASVGPSREYAGSARGHRTPQRRGRQPRRPIPFCRRGGLRNRGVTVFRASAQLSEQWSKGPRDQSKRAGGTCPLCSERTSRRMSQQMRCMPIAIRFDGLWKIDPKGQRRDRSSALALYPRPLRVLDMPQPASAYLSSYRPMTTESFCPN